MVGIGLAKNKKRNDTVMDWLAVALSVCGELVKRGCKKGCTWRCKCLTSDLKCTDLCHCFGQCANSKSGWFIAYLILILKKSTGYITKAFLGPPQHIKLSAAWKMIKYRFSKKMLYKYGKIRIQFCPYTGNRD